MTVTGDFSLTIDQPTLTLPSSGEGFYEIDIAYLHTFTSSNIDLWVEGLPEGVSGRFQLDPLVHQGTTEYLVTTEGIEPGTYSFTPKVKGTYRLVCLVHPTTMAQTLKVE